MHRTRVVIQSRLNSSRLPGKALLTVAGMPLIELVARRAARSGHEVVVATSEEHYDERIVGHLESVGIRVVRGSLDDVLGRFVQATADLNPDDRVVRLTGDNPVADADLVDELLTALEASTHSYGRVDIDQVPEGLGAEAFAVSALREAAASATDAYDREHVTPWLRRHLGELLFVPRGCPADVQAYRATIDTLGDYVRVAALFDELDDPVAAPWLTLMTELASRVDASGRRVGSVGTRFGRLSQVVLSARHFDDGTAPERPAEHSELLRALVAAAVDRGVTHVDVGRADGRSEEALRACAEPALVRRFGIISRLARPEIGAWPSAEATAQASAEATAEATAQATAQVHGLAVEAGLERSFATLGRRAADVLVFPDPATAELGWARARRYRDEGLARGLGVVAHAASDLEWALAHDDVDYVELGSSAVAAAQTLPAVVTALRERGTALVVDVDGIPALPHWATAALVTSTDTRALERAIEMADDPGPADNPAV